MITVTLYYVKPHANRTFLHKQQKRSHLGKRYDLICFNFLRYYTVYTIPEFSVVNTVWVIINDSSAKGAYPRIF